MFSVSSSLFSFVSCVCLLWSCLRLLWSAPAHLASCQGLLHLSPSVLCLPWVFSSLSFHPSSACHVFSISLFLPPPSACPGSGPSKQRPSAHRHAQQRPSRTRSTFPAPQLRKSALRSARGLLGVICLFISLTSRQRLPFWSYVPFFFSFFLSFTSRQREATGIFFLVLIYFNSKSLVHLFPFEILVQLFAKGGVK